MVVSYAQNGEDVVLHRALQKKSGFYVDIGAGFSTLDSVTKLFYDLGWSGINVEPQPQLFSLLQQKRTRDINIQAAVGSVEKETKFTIFPDAWGLATANEQLAREAKYEKKEITVNVLTLESILENHAKGKTIDFLKIDVEGNELDVLKSFDIEKWSPRVLVAEVVAHCKENAVSEPITKYLEDFGYEMTLFDGINCFYAKSSDTEILPRLSYPACCLDLYRLAHYLNWVPLESVQNRVSIYEQCGLDVSHMKEYLEHSRAELERENQAMYKEMI